MLQPAKLLLLILVCALCCTGCAQTKPQVVSSGFTVPKPRPDTENRPDEVLVSDPFERFNRTIYVFNAQFDRYVYLPVVQGYEYVTPRFVQERVSSVFNNLGEVTSFVNSLLQGDIQKAGMTADRILLNTTLGIGGLFDVAAASGIQKKKEDFGQTLGVWGLESGPYLVLPFLGPSSVRDASGIGVDGVLSMARDDVVRATINLKNASGAGVTALQLIDARHQEGFRYYDTGSPFEYSLVRFLYLTKRDLDVEK